MAFSSGSSSPLSASPNITPLIDVLLVLLIIFMVIVPVSPRGLESLVPQPGSAHSPTPQSTPFLVEVFSRPGSRAIAYRVAGQTLDPEALPGTLLKARAGSADAALVIRGDPSLDFQAIATTVAASHQAGFHAIGLLPRTPPTP